MNLILRIKQFWCVFSKGHSYPYVDVKDPKCKSCSKELWSKKKIW